MYRTSLGASGTPSGALSGSGAPTTAPVLDYVCLFTHDLKRKQKRWQDGRLKFHTFNKRVMVYDERANFIGDMHWTEDYDFDEGEEFQLERGCVIVQVAECIGSKEQDLSELIEKRYKDKEERQARAAAATPSRNTARPPPSRPLADVSTTPRANYIGRAVLPTESPYEQRLAQPTNAPCENPRPAKRRRPDISPPSKSGYAQSLFGATLSLSSWSASGHPSRSQDLEETPQVSVPLIVASRPTSRPQAPPSLLQKVRRDRPIDVPHLERRSSLAKPSQPPMLGSKISPEHPTRNKGSSSSHQVQLARPKPQNVSSRNSPDESRGHAYRHRKKDPSSTDEGGSEDEVVETFSRPVPRPLNNSKSANQPNDPIPTKKPTIIPLASLPKAHDDTHAQASSAKSGLVKAVAHPPSEPPNTGQDNLQERSRLVSRIKPSRKRRLLMVSDQQTKNDAARKDTHLDDIHNPPAAKQPRLNAAVARRRDSTFESNGTPKPAPPLASRSGPSRALPIPLLDSQLSDSDMPQPPRQPRQPKPPVPGERASRKSTNNGESTNNEEMAGGNISDGSLTLEDSKGAIPKDKQQSLDGSKPLPDDAVATTHRQETREVAEDTTHEYGHGITEAEARRTSNNEPDQAAVDKTHHFLPRGARLASLRRGVKSKEILYFSSDDDFDDDEMDEPRAASPDVVASPAASNEAGTSAHDEEPSILDSSCEVAPGSKAEQWSGLPLKGTATTCASTKAMRPIESVGLCDTQPPACARPNTASVIIAQTDSLNTAELVNEAPTSLEEATNPQGIPSPQEADGPRASTLKSTPPTVPRVPDAKVTEAGASTTNTTDCAAPSAEQAPAKSTNMQGQRPRLINPATRGRKAALKTDAAGQLPQSVVPPALPPPTTVNQLRMPVPMLAPVPVPGPVRSKTGTSEMVKLPGFSRAGGGAWSKTAHDLLGMERPRS